MKVPNSTRISQRHSRLFGFAPWLLTCGLLVATLNCGSSKKAATTAGGSDTGTTTSPPPDPQPSSSVDPGQPITDTKVQVGLDGNAISATTKAGIYAIVNNGDILIYPYDVCAFWTAHAVGATPADAAGDGAVLKGYATSLGAAFGASFPVSYTVNPQKPAATNPAIKFDEFVIALHYPGACKVTDRGALSGKVTFQSFDGTADNPTIKGRFEGVKVVTYSTPDKPSVLEGNFVATKCAARSGTRPDWKTDPATCHTAGSSPDDPSGVSYE